MNQDLANALIQFANEHDGGTPQPRARYDERLDAVVVASIECLGPGQFETVHEPVRSMSQLRALLGY